MCIRDSRTPRRTGGDGAAPDRCPASGTRTWCTTAAGSVASSRASTTTVTMGPGEARNFRSPDCQRLSGSLPEGSAAAPSFFAMTANSPSGSRLCAVTAMVTEPSAGTVSCGQWPTAAANRVDVLNVASLKVTARPRIADFPLAVMPVTTRTPGPPPRKETTAAFRRLRPEKYQPVSSAPVRPLAFSSQ